MSVAAAQSWLSSHDQPIPTLDEFHDQVLALLKQGVASLAEVADIVMLDPGMSITILDNVNARLKKSKRPGIQTVHTAMGHLGKTAVTNIISHYKKLSEAGTEQAVLNNYRQLISQNYHALAQLDSFAKLQGISALDDMRAALLLYNLGELQTCLFDPDKYQQASKADNKSIVETFGFEFIELGRLLAHKWHLPDLLIESFESTKNTGRKSRLIQLAADIARQAESGWYHKAMATAQKNSADFLSISMEEARCLIQQTAIQAANTSPVEGVFVAAARLILLPDLVKVASPKSVQASPPVERVTTQISLPEQIRALLQSQQANQSNILSLLLNGLQANLNFSRVALMLLSPDKSKLATRAGKSLEESALNKLQFEVAQSGLIKSLLQKPQALRINASNYKKYEAMLPGKLRAACLCDTFVIMSIFVGNSPIGLVYCDRQQIEASIDNESYQAFKSSVMMTSKALTYLVKTKADATA